MLKTDAIFWRKTLERRMTDKVKWNMDIREGGERLKGQEKKKRKQSTCISSLIFVITVSRSSFWY